jgi:hypothetical protein
MEKCLVCGEPGDECGFNANETCTTVICEKHKHLHLKEKQEYIRDTRDKYETFKQTYEDVPTQDNEGYTPDRGSFKSGFLRAWDLRQAEIDVLRKGTEDDARIYLKVLKERDQHLAYAKHLQRELGDAIEYQIKFKSRIEKLKEALKAVCQCARWPYPDKGTVCPACEALAADSEEGK